ncbi:hypothetical protein AMK28_22965 [Streptomyces sp. CB02115]|nr:hypothetical protein AMK28_22965 [Streptomyces sp. CB02115]
MSMMLTVASAVGTFPQTTFAESSTVNDSPEPAVVGVPPSRVLNDPFSNCCSAIFSPTTW